MARYLIYLLVALCIVGCVSGPKKMTLAQAEYQPYGDYVGKLGDRELHYKWDTADPMLHYLLLAKKLNTLPTDSDRRAYRYQSKSLTLEIVDNQFVIDGNQKWLKQMDAGWDDRFNTNYIRAHNAMLSGSAVMGWQVEHRGDNAEQMLDTDFPRALGVAQQLMRELGLNCIIRGYSEQEQYQQAASYVERYRGVHHFRHYACGELSLSVITTVQPDLSSTYSLVKLRGNDEKATGLAEVKRGYEQFKRWDFDGYAAAYSYATSDYSERVATWANGVERILPLMRRKCPCRLSVAEPAL
ncbi:hypothetical protein DU002_12035 [Corallincola holothuriorum]|uniref:Uncharacterized protein n=1 Tax=Corallincola holothuriorum TaxID=2282215 RepID=A0A368NHH1_9GAMM|nr:hypothetical protein [Corallincola holothuriorum]RCU49084.1 hypothetical protein DU002_12035 [Corallincola holothuriorum]